MTASARRFDEDRPGSRLAVDGTDVVWREIEPGLWVGRSNGRHVGTIARGRRFTLTDGQERVRGDFATLAAAQAATGPVSVPPPAGGGRGRDDLDLDRGVLRTMTVVTLVAVAVSLGVLAAVIELGFRLLLS